MEEDTNYETVYEGSRMCPKCGHFMTPVEAMYTEGKFCPDCRNEKYQKNAKSGMLG